ncbi:MAG: maltodextrin glucosidase [Promethearchaeota archaeon]
MSHIKWKETIHSDGSKDFLTPSNPDLGDKIKIKIRLYRKNPIKEIFICCAPEGEEFNILMKKSSEEEFFSYYEAETKIITKSFNYRFMLISEKDQYWFNAHGLTSHMPSDIRDFKIISDFEDPSWIKRSIFYQIFPDRFFDGNPKRNVKNNEYMYRGRSPILKKWGEPPESYKTGSFHIDFYGGDLEGIRKKIPYFKMIGINALYLNPIFKSLSNHKYDTIDYKNVDEHLGTNIEFVNLVNELHQNGIKIILDGVFNHTGVNHPWFKSAQSDKNSPYYEYFIFHTHPDDYLCWLGHKSLPKLNYKSKKVRDDIFREKDSIAQYWLSEPFNIDGWRIDVANMLGRQQDFQEYKKIWEEFRYNVKNVKKDCYLMGEHFFDPTDLLNGTRLDGVMNYRGFYQPFLKWILKKDIVSIYDPPRYYRKSIQFNYSTIDMDQQMADFRSLLPFQIQLLNYNLLNCHDLPRFITLVDMNINKVKLGITFLFSYIGVPSIYYGDEVGLEGEQDPDCRRCMIWDNDKWNKDILVNYKRLIKIRRNSKALQEGSIKTLYCDQKIYCYSRFIEDEIIIAVFNNSNRAKEVKIPVWKIGLVNGLVYDLITDNEFIVENGALIFEIKPYGSTLFSNIKSLSSK